MRDVTDSVDVVVTVSLSESQAAGEILAHIVTI
jgi:hypothetical protein